MHRAIATSEADHNNDPSTTFEDDKKRLRLSVERHLINHIKNTSPEHGSRCDSQSPPSVLMSMYRLS
jgi:hypothetical protein